MTLYDSFMTSLSSRLEDTIQVEFHTYMVLAVPTSHSVRSKSRGPAVSEGRKFKFKFSLGGKFKFKSESRKES